MTGRQERIYPQRIDDPAVREEIAKLRDLPSRVAYLLKLIQAGPEPEQAESAETRDPAAAAYQRLSNQTPVARTGPRVPLRDLAEIISATWSFLGGLEVAGDVDVSGDVSAVDVSAQDITATTLTTTGTLTLGTQLVPSIRATKTIDQYGQIYHTVTAVNGSTVFNSAALPRVVVCGGAGGYNVTLPSVNVVTLGRIVTIKNRSSGAVTVDGFGSQTIDGATTDVLASSGNAVTICAVSASSDHWVKLSEM